MAPLSDREALLAAWRGLGADSAGEGWRSILIGSASGMDVRAARNFPEDKEAFLVGFRGAFVPTDQGLPQAKGFRSTRLVLPGFDAVWFAVVRKDAGSLDLFASMTSDVLALLGEAAGNAGTRLKQVIARVAAWQRFMERGGDRLLGPEEEIGLFGELSVLRSLMVAEADRSAVLEAWRGPLGALHDFRFGNGALEVKTAIAGESAHARISGLQQLDTSSADPLFLVATRLTRSEVGMALGEIAEAAASDCADDPAALALLTDRLLAAGLPRDDYAHYIRRFEVVSIRLHAVVGQFPRLTPANVPPAVIAARYTIDLDQLEALQISVAEARDLLRTT